MGFGIFTSLSPESTPWGRQHEDPNAAYVATLSEAEANAFFAQQSRCYQAVEHPDQQTWNNSDLQHILDQFWISVDNDPRVITAENEWQQCMEVAGYPYANEAAVYDSWYSEDRAVEAIEMAESTAWEPSSPDHDRWRSLVTEEIQTAVALATCSTDLDEVRSDVTRARRSDLLELWQTVDWGAPPVTNPDGQQLVDLTAYDGAPGIPGRLLKRPEPGPSSTSAESTPTRDQQLRSTR